MKTIYEIRAWQKGMDVVTSIYDICKNYPRHELFDLTSQTRRCAVSIPANIAEGFGRFSHPEFLQFLKLARGSIHELRTHLEIAVRVGCLSRQKADPVFADLAELEASVTALMTSIMPRHST